MPVVLTALQNCNAKFSTGKAHLGNPKPKPLALACSTSPLHINTYDEPFTIHNARRITQPSPTDKLLLYNTLQTTFHTIRLRKNLPCRIDKEHADLQKRTDSRKLCARPKNCLPPGKPRGGFR